MLHRTVLILHRNALILHRTALTLDETALILLKTAPTYTAILFHSNNKGGEGRSVPVVEFSTVLSLVATFHYRESYNATTGSARALFQLICAANVMETYL